MKKKIVSLILASMMAVTGLAGCGSSNSAATGGQDTAKGSSGGDVHITYGIWILIRKKVLGKWQMNLREKIQG